MTSLTIVHDAIHANITHLPPGPSAGYTTGTPDIRWTTTDWQHHPAALRIDQDASATDHTADVLDVERGAATFADCPGWYKAALHSYTTAARPGQRHPAIYTSAASVTAVVNALNAGGVHSGPGLWVANWNLTDPQAAAEVAAAAGPYPIIGVQFHSGAFYDTSVFASAWRSAVSAVPAPPPPPVGPFEHHTVAGDTWAKIATARNTTIEHLAQLNAGVELLPGQRYLTTNP
jgi:LysM repeat protein